jgi:hypothetical protein
MRTCWFMLAFALGIVIPAQPQTFHAQTARQALIEMLVNSEPEGFAKHLAEAARKLLPEMGGAPYSFPLSLISTFGGQRLLRGGHVETLDEGPTLLRNEQSETEKLESQCGTRHSRPRER